MDKDSKTTVNGKQITEKTELKNLDRVVFGPSSAFKVIIPKLKKEGEEQTEVSDYDALLQDRLNNDSKEAQNMRKYLEEMRERIGEKKAAEFVRIFQKALEQLDEVNEYTKARYVAFPID